jgi:hypothetical protein
MSLDIDRASRLSFRQLPNLCSREDPVKGFGGGMEWNSSPVSTGLTSLSRSDRIRFAE